MAHLKGGGGDKFELTLFVNYSLKWDFVIVRKNISLIYYGLHQIRWFELWKQIVFVTSVDVEI